MIINFSDAFKIMISPQFEGIRFSHIDGDFGGDTKFGITQKTYNQDCIEQHIVSKSVALLTENEASDIYYRKYWLLSGCDKIIGVSKNNLSLIHFNMSIERSPIVAVKMLQLLVNINPPTGFFGSITLNAITIVDEISLIYNYLEVMKNHFLSEVAKIPNQYKFERGWFNRLNALSSIVNSTWRCNINGGI